MAFRCTQCLEVLEKLPAPGSSLRHVLTITYLYTDLTYYMSGIASEVTLAPDLHISEFCDSPVTVPVRTFYMSYSGSERLWVYEDH